jgi:lipoate-protein ligase A
MRLLNLTLPAAAENLALDEALLEHAEQAGQPAEVLRLWEPTLPMVVVGSSTRVADEVKLDECRRRHVPVLRRASGGAPIVTGPGCLMYAVVLSYEHRPELRSINRAHHFVLKSMGEALQPVGSESLRPVKTANDSAKGFVSDSSVDAIHHTGTSDLAIADRKFSGNSMRCKRTHLLYHGTLLYEFPLEQIDELLSMPTRQPAYRAGRPHLDFVMNLPLPAATLRNALTRAFDADEDQSNWPRDLTKKLATEKYSQDEWNFRL